MKVIKKNKNKQNTCIYQDMENTTIPGSCQLRLLHFMLMLAGNPWYAMWTLASCLVPILILSLLREQYTSTATAVKRESIGMWFFWFCFFWHRVNYSCNLPAIDIICCCVPWTFSSSVPLGAVPCPPSDKWWNTHISDFPFLYMQWLFTVSLHWCAALNRLKNRVSDYLEVLLFSFKFHFFFAWLAMTGSDQTDVMIDEWMLHAPSEFVPAGDVCLTSLRPWGRRHI